MLGWSLWNEVGHDDGNRCFFFFYLARLSNTVCPQFSGSVTLKIFRLFWLTLFNTPSFRILRKRYIVLWNIRNLLSYSQKSFFCKYCDMLVILYVSFKQFLKVVCKTDSGNCKPTTLFLWPLFLHGFTLCCCSMSRYSLFTFSCGYGFGLINTVAHCNGKWDRGCRYGPIPS